MNAYEARRLENIKRNQALIKDLGIKRDPERERERALARISKPSSSSASWSQKRQKLNSALAATRTSARIASSSAKPIYNEDAAASSASTSTAPRLTARQRARKAKSATSSSSTPVTTPVPSNLTPVAYDVDALRASWSSWTPSTTEPPARDPVTFTFHFPTHPTFTPNKSPEEMLREGCFGGSYFRPLYSRHLQTTISDDWRELPASWTQGLDVDRFLTSRDYEPEVNKFKVACGQSIEEWENAGWINHTYDVRGWFQWYCRFFMGRRCQDDERQVSRWKKCVGETGRWRRMLLKRYVALGVKEVFDDGEEGEDAAEVSPVMHQTCHHWAFEVRQDVLDAYWKTGT